MTGRAKAQRRRGDRATGSSHLTKRSDLASSRSRQEMPHDILIVDDEALDAERLDRDAARAVRLPGVYPLGVLDRATRSTVWPRRSPSLTFLDDILKPSGRCVPVDPGAAPRRV